MEYLDLVYLHHFLGDVKAGWRGLESAVRHGKVRSIGISNFERCGCDGRYFHCSHLSQR